MKRQDRVFLDIRTRSWLAISIAIVAISSCACVIFSRSKLNVEDETLYFTIIPDMSSAEDPSRQSCSLLTFMAKSKKVHWTASALERNACGIANCQQLQPDKIAKAIRELIDYDSNQVDPGRCVAVIVSIHHGSEFYSKRIYASHEELGRIGKMSPFPEISSDERMRSLKGRGEFLTSFVFSLTPSGWPTTEQ